MAGKDKDKKGGYLLDMVGFKSKKTKHNNPPVRPPSEDFTDRYPIQDNMVDDWSAEKVVTEFEKMLDDMNLAEDRKVPLREQMLNQKRQMLKMQYKKDHMDEKKHSAGDYLSILTNTQHMSHEKLCRIMESLRIALTNNTISWVKEFGQEGLEALLKIFRRCYEHGYKSDKIVAKIQHECVKCLKAIMNLTDGLKRVFEHDDAINLLARSISSHNESIASDAMRLLATVCFITPNGHGKALEAITILGEIESQERFLTIIQKLNTSDVSLKSSCILLINCLINQAEDLDFRTHIRNECMRAGLTDCLEILHNEDSSSEIGVQLKVFHESKESDYDEFIQRFENAKLEFEDLNDCYDLVKQMVLNTPAENYLLSILQHLMCIRDDVAVRGAYFKLIEECVSQIILHKSGCDPDFRHTKRFKIDVEPLIESIVEKSRQEEQFNSQELHKKLEEALTSKQEYEAKFAQCESEKKALQEQMKKMAAGGPTPPGVLPLTPVTPGSAIPPPPPMPGMGGNIPPPPPMPGMGGNIPPPPPMPGMGGNIPPPPPMPGMGGNIPPPPPMPGMGPPPPPPMPGMGPPPPPFPGMSPGIGFTPSPITLNALPYGMKPKKAYKPNNPLKRINWKIIQPNKLSENAFWVQVEEEKLESDDIFDSLASRFSSLPPLKKMQDNNEESGKKTLKKAKDLKVIDPKAAQSLMILLGSVKLNPTELRDYILQMDEENLTDAMLQQLIRYVPEPEQLAKLELYKDQFNDLAEAEQFAITLGSIKRLVPRLKSMSFKLRFPELVQDIKPDIVAATAACEEVKASKKFTKILEVVLLVGNYMNSGSRNGQAVGFEINFLTKLSSTKALDSKTTLLHFLAEVSAEKFPEVLNFPEEIIHLDRAARVSPDQILKNINQMKKSVQQLDLDLKNFKPQSENDIFGAIMTDFLEESRKQSEVLENMYKKMSKLYEELSDFYVFDPKKYSLDEFFGDIKIFKDQFIEAHKENMKLRETEEKQRRAKEIREKAEKEKAERKAQKHLLDITSAGNDQEGVMDNLLEALKTGDAFQHKPRRKAPPRGGADRRAMLNRSRSRQNILYRESGGMSLADACR